MGFRIAATTTPPGNSRNIPDDHAADDHMQTLNAGRRVQRLVAKALDVERETALVVGSDNVLLGSVTEHTGNTLRK